MRTLRMLVALVALAVISGTAMVGAGTPPSPDIVGGQDVPDPNPYTYQVSIGTANSTFCGGSVIATTWVLTAAHCFVDANTGAVTDPTTLVVRVGIRAISAATAADERTVAQLIVHPQYDRVTSANDIALLQLGSAVQADWIVTLADAANDAALTVPGTVATATGWGGLQAYAPPAEEPPGGQTYPDILRFVQMPIVANATCGINASQLCAGLEQGGVDTCQGDSGGPLVVLDGASFVQVGVVSFGVGCASPGNYGVYTRVSSFRDWLSTSMGDGTPVQPAVYMPITAR